MNLHVLNNHLPLSTIRPAVPSGCRHRIPVRKNIHVAKCCNVKILQSNPHAAGAYDVRSLSLCQGEAAVDSPVRSAQRLALAIGSALVMLDTSNAQAVEMVPASQVMQMARPLPQQQKVDKGKVWTIFIGGAATLFLGTLAVENSPSLFPAIARANQAASKSKQAIEADELREAMETTTAQEIDRQTAMVEQALLEARKQRAMAAVAEARTSTPSQQELSSRGVTEPGPDSPPSVPSPVEGAEASDAGEAEKKARLSAFVNNMTGAEKEAVAASKSSRQDSNLGA